MRALCILILLAAMPLAAAANQAAPVDPALAVTTLDGQEWSLADQRGKWVVVNFWATWCSPCIREMPDIDEFAAAHDEVTAIGLAWQDASAEEIRKFLGEHPVRYPIALVDPFDTPGDFPAPRGLPTTWLIDPEGRVARHFLGPVTGRDLARAAGLSATGP